MFESGVGLVYMVEFLGWFVDWDYWGVMSMDVRWFKMVNLIKVKDFVEVVLFVVEEVLKFDFGGFDVVEFEKVFVE